jgi:hypothetical protein
MKTLIPRFCCWPNCSRLAKNSFTGYTWYCDDHYALKNYPKDEDDAVRQLTWYHDYYPVKKDD